MAARSNHTEKSLIILKLTLDITLHDKKKENKQQHEETVQLNFVIRATQFWAGADGVLAAIFYSVRLSRHIGGWVGV